MDQKTKLIVEYNKCVQEVKELYDKLNLAYDKEVQIIKDIKALKHRYDQMKEDKEVLQMMYMHHSNKLNRIKRFIGE